MTAQRPVRFTGRDMVRLLSDLVTVDSDDMGRVLDVWLPINAPTRQDAFAFLWALADAVVAVSGIGGGGGRFASLQVSPDCSAALRTAGQLLTTSINQDVETKSAVLHALITGDMDTVSEVLCELAVVFRGVYDARAAAGR